MKSAEETLAHISEVIAKIYQRPEMYGHTPDAVDSVLFAYHHVWGFVAERLGDISNAQIEVEPNSMSAPKTVEAAIKRWRSVDKLVGINTS